MVGVAAIIIVMAVMNGFREELTSRLLGINGDINIYSTKGEIDSATINSINKLQNKSFKFIPFIETQALITNEGNSKGIFIRSYNNYDLDNKKFIKQNIIKGKTYSNESNEIIIGYALAKELNLDIGSKVKLAIPKMDKTIFGNIPRFKTLIVVGIFDIGMYEYDSNFVFTNPNISRKLLLLEEGSFKQIEIATDNPVTVEYSQKIINNYLSDINDNLYSITWKQNNSSLINALKVEKNVMFLILVLIIIVASMNIISGLIIFVKEKNKDIGILKTIGLSQFSLIKIFVSIGFFIGFLGTFFGVLLGVFISLNIQSIQSILENTLKTNLFSKEIYYLSSLPSRLNYNEVLLVIVVSLIISLISTLFPAYRSSIIDPIKTIKND